MNFLPVSPGVVPEDLPGLAWNLSERGVAVPITGVVGPLSNGHFMAYKWGCS